MFRKKSPNHWKGLMVGMVGSIAGTMAMNYYWKNIAPVVAKKLEKLDLDFSGTDARARIPGSEELDNETATMTLGDQLYEKTTGEELDIEEKPVMGNIVHWSYAVFQSGLYGAIRTRKGIFDTKGGLVFGTVLWLIGDELIVPLLGLKGKRVVFSPVQHVNKLGANLAYGVGTSTVSQILARIL